MLWSDVSIDLTCSALSSHPGRAGTAAADTDKQTGRSLEHVSLLDLIEHMLKAESHVRTGNAGKEDASGEAEDPNVAKRKALQEEKSEKLKTQQALELVMREQQTELEKCANACCNLIACQTCCLENAAERYSLPASLSAHDGMLQF